MKSLRLPLSILCLVFAATAVAGKKEGSNPLIAAAQAADLKQIKLLLKKSPSSINDRNSIGETALIQVGETGDLDTYLTLAKAGADINATDSANQNVLYYSIANGHTELALEILKNPKLRLGMNLGKKQENILFIAAEKGNLSVIEGILALDQTLAVSKNSKGMTPAAVAKKFEHKKAAELIKKLSPAK